MKRVFKKIIMILAGLVCAVLIAICVLSLISIKPLDRIGDYNKENIRILSAYGQVQATNSQKKEAIDNAFDTVKFSVFRSVYEGSTDYNIKPVTKKNADDETVNVTRTAAEFTSLTPAAGQFMIELRFDGDYRTNERFKDNDGELIRYDRVILIISKPEKDKLAEVKIYPYVLFNTDNQMIDDTYNADWHIGSDYYEVYEFRAKMNTYEMHEILSEEFVAGKSGAGDITA